MVQSYGKLGEFEKTRKKEEPQEALTYGSVDYPRRFEPFRLFQRNSIPISNSSVHYQTPELIYLHVVQLLI